MTTEQLRKICQICIDRCRSGNTWPPDFAEFVSLVAESGGGLFGLTVADVIGELTRWRNESYRYGTSEQFPWRHPVLYHICIEIRRVGVDRKLTKAEQEKLAGTLLQKWEKKITAGYSIPPIRRQLAAPAAQEGLTPAQKMMEEYQRRKAAGRI